MLETCLDKLTGKSLTCLGLVSHDDRCDLVIVFKDDGDFHGSHDTSGESVSG